MRVLLEIGLEDWEFDRIDLRSTARNGTEDIGRLFLIDRQLADETPPRRKAQGEHTAGLAVFHNEDMPRAHNVEIAR